MKYREEALVFDCNGDALVSILARPLREERQTAVLVVVGGPQYRVGSHRQFVELSRTLASAGIPCLRFDYRGMGDSEGNSRNFSDVNDDIAAAVEILLECCPELDEIVLWGLCDGATAAAFYASTDARVSGLVLLNPWVHTEQSEARVYLKYYYIGRVTSAAFWRKLFSGEFSVVRAIADGWQLVSRALGQGSSQEGISPDQQNNVPDRLLESLKMRDVRTLIMLSGKDYVATEFEDLCKGDSSWMRIVERATIHRFPNADHTFSDPLDADQAARTTRDWILASP